MERDFKIGFYCIHKWCLRENSSKWGIVLRMSQQTSIPFLWTNFPHKSSLLVLKCYVAVMFTDAKTIIVHIFIICEQAPLTSMDLFRFLSSLLSFGFSVLNLSVSSTMSSWPHSKIWGETALHVALKTSDPQQLTILFTWGIRKCMVAQPHLLDLSVWYLECMEATFDLLWYSLTDLWIELSNATATLVYENEWVQL